jgi:hypothetical protein
LIRQARLFHFQFFQGKANTKYLRRPLPWNFDKQVLILKKPWQIALFKKLLGVRACDVL